MSAVVINIVNRAMKLPFHPNFQKFLIVLLFYFLVVLFYLEDEKDWTVVDCIYFITVTITTVGYGDETPDNDIARGVTIAVIFFGLMVVFGLVNDFALFVMEYAEKTAKAIANRKPSVKEKAIDPYKFIKKRAKIVLVVLCVMVGGSLFLMESEGWNFLDAFYFCVVTTTTVGYGDFIPSNETSKIFLIIYIPFSVVSVAAAMGQFISCRLEIEAEAKRMQLLSRKLDFAMLKELDSNGDGVSIVSFIP